ncbi:MAG: hypothetical protein EBR40_09320 [Proteobacteria bacterium]|nr:hypothetical protein [Pseudomonadota bacterium]
MLPHNQLIQVLQEIIMAALLMGITRGPTTVLPPLTILLNRLQPIKRYKQTQQISSALLLMDSIKH